MPVPTTPEHVKAWADATTADDASVGKLLRDIQDCARYAPRRSMPLHSWWVDAVGKGGTE